MCNSQDGDRIWRQFKNGENKDCSSSNFGHHDFCRPKAQTFGSSSPQRWSPARVACLLVLHMFGFHLPPSSVPLDTFVPRVHLRLWQSSSIGCSSNFYSRAARFSTLEVRAHISYYDIVSLSWTWSFNFTPNSPLSDAKKSFFWHQWQKGQRSSGRPSSKFVTFRISCSEILSVM